MSKKIVILGGGTFSPVRNHLSLCAPAFGKTATMMKQIFKNKFGDKLKLEGYRVVTMLTKMADSDSVVMTNKDVEKYVDRLIEDKDVKTVILNVAFCDYDVIDEEAGFHGQRLKTSDGDVTLNLRPSKKIIDKIRVARPDIYLVGFKTTTNASDEEQFLTGLKMMKRSKCNLVLANDTVTRKNIIITPEESKYTYSSRKETIHQLCEIIMYRHNLTYSYSKLVESPNIPLSEAPSTFQTVLKYLIDNNGFIVNNGNGFTPGHFCYRVKEPTGVFEKYENKFNKGGFVSSQRKVDHNKVFENGMSYVDLNFGGTFDIYGTHKASVGARSQWIMFSENPEYDCIIHTHSPLKPNSGIPIVSQKEFQCGSIQCGVNTVTHLKEFGDNILAVYLDKHGYNIMFKSSCDPKEVIDFINDNIELGVKTN